MGLVYNLNTDQRWAVDCLKQGMKPGWKGLSTKEIKNYELLVDIGILRRVKDMYEKGPRFNEVTEKTWIKA